MPIHGFRNLGFFSQSSIPFNMLSWYDSSDLSTISHSSNLVDSWLDKSGNGRNLSASGSQRPVTNTSTQNGLNVISFNGTSQFMIGNTSITSNNFTFFTVASRTGAGVSSNTYSRALSLWNTGVGNDYSETTGFVCHYSSVGFNSVSPPLSGIYRNSSSIASTPLSYGAANRTTVILNGSSASLNHNGVTVSGSTSSTSMNANRLTVGAGGPGGGADQFLFGWVAEHILYDYVLSTSEIDSVNLYLKNKWNTV